MTFGYLNNLNNHCQTYQNLGFGAVTVPAQDVKKNPIDKISERFDEEKKKKHNKRAIAVGGTVIGLSLIVTALNPRISSKLIEQLRTLQYNTSRNIERHKGDLVKSKFYKIASEVTDWCARFLQSINNINSVKDTYYKQLCTEDKTFFGIRDMQRRKRFEKYDNIFRKVMQKPHEVITRWGDNLAKATVKGSYKSASKKMDELEKLISEYSNKMPAETKSEINNELSKIRTARTEFSVENIDKRFAKQESLMSNLNSDIRTRWIEYRQGFRNKFVKTSEHFNRNLSFWAHDIMEPDRQVIVEDGLKRVDYLFGNKNGTTGEYRELAEKLSANLNSEEKALLEKNLKKAEKSLRTANKTECEEYFDKKRDLILGSAPTDILSSVLSLGLCGIALVSTDDRDKRISKLLTGIVPIITGLGVNIVLTMMLFSGTKGLLYGFAASGVLSLLGSKIDKERLAAKNKLPDETI